MRLKENLMQDTEEGKDEFADLPEVLRSVARKHGREMLMLVYNANMVNQALGVVAAQAQKHASRRLAQGLQTRAAWPEAALKECEEDILRAFQAGGPRIVGLDGGTLQ